MNNSVVKRQRQHIDESESISANSRKLNYSKLRVQQGFCEGDLSRFEVALSLVEQAYSTVGEGNRFADYLDELLDRIILPYEDDDWIFETFDPAGQV